MVHFVCKAKTQNCVFVVNPNTSIKVNGEFLKQ